MVEVKPVDFHREKPFNYTEIIKRTDEFLEMLKLLDIAFPVLSYAIERNKELKSKYQIIREKKPKLFYD